MAAVQIKCPGCGKIIGTDDARATDSCPHCGKEFVIKKKPADAYVIQPSEEVVRPKRRRLPTWAIILIVIGAVFIVFSTVILPIMYVSFNSVTRNWYNNSMNSWFNDMNGGFNTIS